MARESETPSKPGKGHATPSRKEQEAKRKRPLVLDRKADAARIRSDRKAQLDREYQAMRTGDERNMPPQHQGAPRRFARDYVDSRTLIGEFLLPAAFVALVSMMLLLRHPLIAGGINLGFMLLVLGWLGESVVVLRGLRKAATAKFGGDRLPPRYRMYALGRMWQMRALRMPKPQVKRGEYPA